jgi:hypothetical protein
MTVDDFRRLALSLDGAEERSHMSHPDFRVGKKIFATLSYPNEEWAMVKLTPEQQDNYMRAAPEAFEPCSGVWGRRGATHVRLKTAKKTMVRKALQEAWGNLAVSGSPGSSARNKR